MTGATVLVADDDAAIRTVLNQALSRAGYDVRITSNAATLWRWISAGEGDIVVTDVVMPDENAFDLLPRIKKARPDLPVLVMSAQNTFMTAIKASERGAYDYLPKPFDLTELIAIIGRALAEPKKKPAKLDDDTQDGMPLVGRSAAMQEIYRVLARLMQTDLTLMITGESGTGKELVARALHDYGKRRNGPFVAINMAAIPRDLIESELFGHEKGAFTGAQNRSTGRFEQAEGGTLFLDEIGDMPMDAQTRLLRVLQEGEYTMVGGRTAIKSNVRIIAATHRDLSQMIRQGLFRNLVRRLSALYADESISGEVVQNELNLTERPATPAAGGSGDISAAVESHIAQLLREFDPKLPPAGLYQRVLDRVEAPLIAMALNACGGNQIKAADLLGLNRNTLRKKIRAHSIEIVKHSRRNT
jgi:two-component system nitrogen regulation response regulator GlnG